MKDVLASVVIPVGRDSRTLGECLESIGRQDFPKKEVIIVCDRGAADLPSLPGGSENVRVIRERGNAGLAHLSNSGLRAARGHVKILLMPYCIPIGPRWLSEMTAPFQDEDVGVVISQCRPEHGAEPGLAARLLDSVDPRERRTRPGGPRRQDMVSHLCDAYRASLLADIGYFEEDCLKPPGEAIDISVKIADAGYRVLLGGSAVAACKVPDSDRSVASVLGKARDYGFSDGRLDRIYSLRWLNAGVFAAALASLFLLPLAALELRAALVLSAAIFAWGWFLGVRVPVLGWDCPVALLNFAAYVLIVLLIRDDWRPGLFGTTVHPSLIRQWCWLAAVTGSYLLMLVKAGLVSAARTCRRRRGWLYAAPVFALSMAWWLLAGTGYAAGRFLSPHGRE